MFAADGVALGLYPFALVYAGFGLLSLGLGLLTGYGALAATRQLARLSVAWGRKVASPFLKSRGEAGGGASGDSHSGPGSSSVVDESAATSVGGAADASVAAKSSSETKARIAAGRIPRLGGASPSAL